MASFPIGFGTQLVFLAILSAHSLDPRDLSRTRSSVSLSLLFSRLNSPFCPSDTNERGTHRILCNFVPTLKVEAHATDSLHGRMYESSVGTLLVSVVVCIDFILGFVQLDIEGVERMTPLRKEVAA